MNLSERGYRTIKAYEGYHTATPDGGCVAYREKINGKLDVWTIGYGCTKGITGSTRWTLAQAEESLRKEIAIHERRVTQLITVELNQNEYDACVSFDYNTGGLTTDKGKPSGFRLALNKGDRNLAMRELETWNKFGGKPAKALIARRADEKALFLEPVGPSTPASMPQAVEEARTPLTEKQAATVTAGGGAGVLVAANYIPKPPAAILEHATAWRGFSTQVLEFGAFAISSPKSIAVIVVAGLAVWFGPKLAPRLFGGS